MPSVKPTPVPGLEPLKSTYFKGDASAVDHDQIVEVTYAPSAAPTDAVQGEAAALAEETAAETGILAEMQQAKEAKEEVAKDKKKQKFYKKEEAKLPPVSEAKEIASVHTAEVKMKEAAAVAEAKLARARAAEAKEKQIMRAAKQQENKAAVTAAAEARAAKAQAASSDAPAAAGGGGVPHVELYGLAAILVVSAPC
jgi:hypothetical protein